MMTTAYLKAIMEVYGKTLTGQGPYSKSWISGVYPVMNILVMLYVSPSRTCFIAGRG